MPRYKISSGKIYNIPDEKVQDFLFKYPEAVLIEEEKQGKVEGPVEETAVAGPTNEAQQQAVDTVSPLEDGSLDLPPTETFSIDGKSVSKKEFDKYTAMQEAVKTAEQLESEDPSVFDKIGYELFKTKQYVFNALGDIPERAKKVYLETQAVTNDYIKRVAGEDAADFLFGENVPEGAVAYIDPETNSQVVFAENPDKWKELNALNQRTDTYVKSVYAGSDQEIGIAADRKYVEVMKQADKLGKEMQYTGGGMTAGFKGLVGAEGYEEYGAADLLAGGFNAVFNVLETAVPAVLTRGASIYPQIAAPMFADYNRTKAETLYPDSENALELLVENNEVEFTTPAILSTIAVQSERLGLKGLSNYIMKAPLASKGILNMARLATVSSGEGMVEVSQGITETINNNIAQGKTTGEVSEQVVKYIGSDQALDAFLGGFVGQAGVGAGGRAINRALRGGSQGQAKVNTLLTDLEKLKNEKKQTKNKISKDVIQEDIAQKESELKKYLEENNEVSKKLTEQEKQELLNLLDSKDALYSQAFDLRNQKSEGSISNKDYGYAIRSINNQAKQKDNRIDEIRQEAAKREIEVIAEKVSKVSKALGGKAPQLFDTTEEYVQAVAKDQDIDVQEARSMIGGTEGVFAGKGNIFIDKQQAAKVGNIGVAAHEFLHPVLNALVGDVNQQAEIVNGFEKILSKDQIAKVNKKLEAYKDEKTGELDPEVRASEYLTVFSNAIINGDIQYNEGIFTKIGDYIRGILGKYGFKNANFETGKGVYNFLKEYNKTIQKEEGLSQRAIDLIKKREAETGVKVSEVDVLNAPQFSKTDLKSEIDTFVQEGGSKKYDTKAEFQMSNDFTDAYTKIADSNLLDGSVLSLINRDNNLSGLSDSVKAEIIEKTKENISMRFIQNFDPAKNESLFGWMLGKNGALGFAVLDVKKDYAKTAKEMSLDVERGETGFVGDIAVESTIEEQMDAPEAEIPKSKFRRQLKKDGKAGISQELIDTVKSEVQKTVDEGFNVDDAKFRRDIINKLEKKLKTAVQTMIGGGKNYEKFLKENREILIDNLPISYFVAAERKVPENERIFSNVVKRNLSPTEVRQTVDKDLIYTESETSGPTLYKKRMPSEQEFLEFFGITKSLGSTKGTRKDKLAQQVGANLALDMLPTVLREKGVSQAEQAKVGVKTRRDPRLQFSRTLSSEMSSEKGDIFWSSKNIKTFKELIDSDPKNIGNKFKEVYAGVFNNEQKIASELDAEYENWKNLDEDKKGDLSEHMIEFITSFGLRAGLKNVLNLGKNSLNFRNKKQLESARKALQELVKNISEEDFMKYLLPTLQSGWGLIGGKFVAEKNSDGYILTEVNQDGSKSFRYHLVSGRNDAINILLKDVFKNETSYVPRSTEAIINGKKIKTTVVPSQTASDFASGKFEKNLNKRQDFARDQRNGMLKISETLQELLNNGSISANDVGMILMTFSSNTNALIRTAAIPQNKFDGDFSENTEFVYEHSKPAREILIQISDLIGNNKLNDKSYNKLMKDYVVTILPKAYDDIINKHYKDFSPIDKQGKYLKSTANKPSRYFNDFIEAEFAIEGLPPLKLIPLGTKPKRKVVLQPSRSTDKTAKKNREKIINKQFNDILENKTGIAAEKQYSAAKAEVVGASKGKFNWFIPPTAEDFVGLLYQFLGKGKIGDLQMAWFKVNLLNPYARAVSKISRDRISTARNYRALKKELKIVPKDLKKKVPGEEFTKEQAIRVYIWTKQGYEIPGLSKTDSKDLRKFIQDNKDLKEFGDKLIALNSGFDYAKPDVGWLSGTITTDLLETLNTSKRDEYLSEWQENVNVIFSEANLNKIEAAYGPSFRYALENSLTRMKTGRNRAYGTDSLTGRVTDWLANSIGAIMFFNTRSAILQTLSSVNFINLSDNNILAAGKAFANQKQYWSDFLKLFNSDFLVDRRDGLRLNVNESDIADMAKQGGARGVVSEILKAGFLPTQIADSFAIASGGATFYRNRLKRYIKEGIDPKKAEEMAFMEFREIAEESQQSSRPDKISAQQAGPLGRIILAFANTPAQYARLMKKAASDLKNGRGDAKSNISKIIYYGIAQNLIFNAMQQALFAIAFGDEEEEEEKKQKKAINIANSMADSILRGMGIGGAIVSVLKNTAKKLIERSEKKQPDYAENALMELLKISPPISSKAGKVKNAFRSYEWDKDDMYEKGLALDNPAYLAAGNIVSAATNIPLDRAVKKVTNVKNSMNEDLQLWQRIALLAGWQDWEIDAKEEKKEKENRGKIKFKTTNFKQVKFK